jgi:hypothetical protein
MATSKMLPGFLSIFIVPQKYHINSLGILILVFIPLIG